VTATFQENLVWLERAALPQPRAGYIGGVIHGRYVVAGGSFWEGNRKRWSARVDVFDPRIGTWSEAESLPKSRSDCACATVGNRLYVFGGQDHDGAKLDSMILMHGQWRPLPEADLPEPRLYATAVASGDWIYIVGGLSKAGEYASAWNTLWRWSTSVPKSRWQILQGIPGPGVISLAAAAIGQKIYVFGGANAGGHNVVNSNNAFEFDSRTQRWTQLPDLPISRRCWSAVPLDNKVLLIGGYTEDYEKEVFQYDLAAHALSSVGVLPRGVCDARFFRIGGAVVGAGGETGHRIRGACTFESRLPSSWLKGSGQ
jgi:N-acetylneuraminic acid mutarotase